ncbi:MAG: DUF1653 domain-containing protein [Candidatus Vogelbacteria bacterium]|nr:DUF1653 domain-containing protein [Candidatus Vogelbacteria bacterium]
MEIRPGTYEHFKGGLYKVHSVAKHSETLEEFVVYEHLTPDKEPTGDFWVRPASMWFEEVDKPEYKGPRFTFISNYTQDRPVCSGHL